MTPAPLGGWVVAHGVDIVDVARVARSIERHEERFVERVFTEAERDYCAREKRSNEHFAARFAAKEAVFKALGTGWAQGIAWRDVEVSRAASGEPGVVLAGRAAQLADERGINAWSLSLSHTSTLAMASAIALRSD